MINKIQRQLIKFMALGERKLHLLGWYLFIISAIGFCIASIGNFWAMFGSVFFLLACIVFLIPLLMQK